MCRKRQTHSEDSPPAYGEDKRKTQQEKGDHSICQLNHADVVRLARQFDSSLRLGVCVNHADACVIHKHLNVKLLRPDLLDTTPNRVRICQVNKQVL